MKTKKIVLVAVSLGLIMTLTSCLTNSIKQIDYKGRSEIGTPENSVIIIGCYSGNTYMAFSQCDSEYPPDNQEMVGQYVVSAPVAPGSRYRLQSVSGQMRSGQTVWYWDANYSMQVNSFDIKVPNEPGIYYIGYFSGKASYQNGEPVPITKNVGLLLVTNADPEKQEKECLQYALNAYKGTVWYDVIKERIGELK